MPFLSDLVGPVYAELARRMSSDEPIGLSTGIPVIDEAIGGGWVRQRLSYLLGDSNVGKSWLASSWILRGAQWLTEHVGERPATGHILGDSEVSHTVHDKEGKPPIIVFWSLEMAESQIVTRLLTQMAKDLFGVDIDSGHLQRGIVDATPGTPEWDRFAEVMQTLYELICKEYGTRLYMEFEAQTIAEFRSTLDALAEMYDICFVVIDYFRLIDEVSMDGNMASIQAERSKKLKAIARDYDCHVLSVFDMTREGQKVDTPMPYHMKGGSAAHYDADLVLIVSAEDKNQEAPPHRHLRFYVAKGRDVPNTRVDLHMNLATGYVELWDQRTSTLEMEDTPWLEKKGG